MPAALELVTARATAIGATLAAMTANDGNTFSVRNATPGSGVALLQVWADVQVAGTLRIRSPQLHDNVQGLRFDTVVGEVTPLLPWGVWQELMPQDTLIVELAGSAVAGDVETIGMLVYYFDLPGIEANLFGWGDVAPRIRNIVTVENTLATGLTGNYTGEEALSAEFNLLKANTNYAILGYMVDAEVGSIRYRGSDLGNFGVGGPGEPGIRHVTKDWFVLLSQSFNLPLIPVFNAANVGALLLDSNQDENGADVTVTTILAELAS